VAPEHTSDRVLYIMRKPPFEQFYRFKRIFDRINKELNLRQQIIPYFISSHPGCTEEDMAELAVITKRLDFHLEQVQDFTPTPMTVATEAWYTGYHPYTLELYGKGLKACCEENGIQLVNHHDALADAEACAKLYLCYQGHLAKDLAHYNLRFLNEISKFIQLFAAIVCTTRNANTTNIFSFIENREVSLSCKSILKFNKFHSKANIWFITSVN
jgi:hypothetical protein